MKSTEFDAALSFAGTDRELARAITRELSPLGYHIYYDDYFETWGQDLAEVLHEIYSQVNVVIILVSDKYNARHWTRFERKAAVSNFIHREGKILQIKMDDSILPGVPETIQYKKYTGHNVHELCSSIVSVLGEKRNIKPVNNEQIVPIITACYRRAIYTSMDSEISSKAMFQSIRECIGELSRIMPTIRDGSLSQYVKSILRDLDHLDRFSNRSANYTCTFNAADKMAINSMKLGILDKLHFLNHHFHARIDLPSDIGLAHQMEHFQFRDEIV